MYVGMEAPADSENWEQDPDVLEAELNQVSNTSGSCSQFSLSAGASMPTYISPVSLPLADQAVKNQSTDNAVDFFPPRFNNTFMTWMENVHDNKPLSR
jgi:hypothetical protein